MPVVSVILPVYNGERFLKEAIDSILVQTFTDFELIIINDGSTDGSEKIIQSYNDNRIVYLKNKENLGFSFSLNKGIDEAKGNWMARMDADDIALPHRLEKQFAYVENHRASIVASRVNLIDAEGKPLPPWAADQKNTTSKQIKNYLIIDNCIAHPAVFGKTTLFKEYKYRASQKYSEDYDLWLRLAADGVAINKIEEPLLLYRILPTSMTRFKKMNVFLLLAKVKFRFAGYQFTNGKISGYVFTTLLFACLDLVKAAGKEIKSLFKK